MLNLPRGGWALLLGCFAASAQTPAPAPLKLGPLTLQGNIRSRTESWDWFPADADGSYTFQGSFARLSLSQKTGRFDWGVEWNLPFLLNLPQNAIAPGAQGQLGLGAAYFAANDRSRNAAGLFLRQAFLRVGLDRKQRHTLQLGRIDFIDGSELTPKDPALAMVKRDRVNQRLIGPFGFTHVWRSYDGGHYVFTRRRDNFHLLAARSTRGVFQTDGWGDLDVGIVYGSWNRAVTADKQSGDLRLFGSYYHDWRRTLKVDNRPEAVRRADTGNIRIGTYGGHYLHVVQTPHGSLDFLVWGVGQTGRWGRLDHRAGAYLIEGGWQLPGANAFLRRWKPWFRGGWYHGSGDSDPTDTVHGTFFQMLPTPRPFARFPFFNMMNNQDASGMLTLRPAKPVVIKVEYHALRLARRQDLWIVGGGPFQPWTFGYAGRNAGGARGLANLWDASIDYQVNAHVLLVGYFGHAQGKSAVSAVYPKGRDGNLGYVEVTYRF